MTNTEPTQIEINGVINGAIIRANTDSETRDLFRAWAHDAIVALVNQYRSEGGRGRISTPAISHVRDLARDMTIDHCDTRTIETRGSSEVLSSKPDKAIKIVAVRSTVATRSGVAWLVCVQLVDPDKGAPTYACLPTPALSRILSSRGLIVSCVVHLPLPEFVPLEADHAND